MTDRAAEDDWGALSSLPGNPLMWVLILSEIVVFSAFFLAFAAARVTHLQLFRAGQAGLDPLLGGINTLVLLTSGWAAASAVRNRAEGRRARARRRLAAAMGLGCVFIAVKLVEYAGKIAQGFDIDSDTFHTLYFLMTGFHLMHVIFGVVVLGLVGWWDSVENMETGAAFWHMVDLIWLVLFPLLYLMR